MTVTIRHGDCRDVLRTLPDESVHCCVTSPPYFGLRDYGTASWSGGDPACDHRNDTQHQKQGATSARAGRSNVDEQRNENFRDICGKCGAARADKQIGLEPTPDAFVAELVDVFREVRRVLRDDGTLWLNLGDSYAGSWGAQSRGGPPSASSTLEGNGHIGGGPKLKGLSAVQIAAHPKLTRTGAADKTPGCKPKDLIGIPWMVAFALRADGWYLRQDIIWSKPNPMPESVTDRCTKAHEYIFLMSKSARYFYDAGAIAEDVTASTIDRLSQPNLANQTGSDRVPGKTNGNMKAVASKRLAEGAIARTGGLITGGTEKSSLGVSAETTRNRRSVWSVATQPFSEAHFATFPPDLIEPCIKAGCPEGGTVIDPFGGAGTTGLVADRLKRNALLIELNPEYAAMAERRIRGDAGMFAEVDSSAGIGK